VIRLFFVLHCLLKALRSVADGLDLMPAHELEAMAAVLELGHGIEADDFATIAHCRGVVQFFIQAVDQFESVVLADFVRRNADDLAGSARKVDQPFVANDHLNRVHPPIIAVCVLALGVERHKVGVAKNRVRLKAHLRTLADGADEASNIAFGERWRRSGGDLRDLQQAFGVQVLRKHLGNLARLLL
jgi:hypothetical protein